MKLIKKIDQNMEKAPKETQTAPLKIFKYVNPVISAQIF